MWFLAWNPPSAQSILCCWLSVLGSLRYPCHVCYPSYPGLTAQLNIYRFKAVSLSSGQVIINLQLSTYCVLASSLLSLSLCLSVCPAVISWELMDFILTMEIWTANRRVPSIRWYLANFATILNLNEPSFYYWPYEAFILSNYWEQMGKGASRSWC